MTVTKKHKFELHNWMKNFDDGLLLSQLSIPGTHDTCAAGCIRFAECQSMGLEEQLNSGVRFIDIRCRHVNDVFKIFHGMVDLKLTFESVQDTCIRFLTKNPSECIIMNVQIEPRLRKMPNRDSDPAAMHKLPPPNATKRSFEEVLLGYIEPHRSFWHLEANEVPSLKETRGKIVLMRNFAAQRPLGIDITEWLHNCTFTLLKNSIFFNVQNEYRLNFYRGKQEKFARIKRHLELARADVTQHTWFFNFTNGVYMSYPDPYLIAMGRVPGPSKTNAINRKLTEHLREMGQKYENRLGTIVMDYATKDLIVAIIDHNAFTDNENEDEEVGEVAKRIDLL